MNHLRLTIALTILLLILLIFRFITEPFAPANIIVPISESLAILGIGLVWGVIIYLPLRLFRGPDKSPDSRSFIVYTAVAFIALYMVYHFIR